MFTASSPIDVHTILCVASLILTVCGGVSLSVTLTCYHRALRRDIFSMGTSYDSAVHALFHDIWRDTKWRLAYNISIPNKLKYYSDMMP